MRRARGSRTLLVVVALLVGATAGRIATASTAVPGEVLGYGSAATSPYATSNVSYGLAVDDPQEIGSVSFTISPASARAVEVELDGTWYPCTNSAGAVNCTTAAPITVNTSGQPTTTLTVVATQ